MLAAVAACLAAAPARAADPPARVVSPADSAARAAQPKSDPFKVMLRSALVPGWGQLYTHQPLKAAAVVGGEGFLFASAFRELKRQNDAIDRAVFAAAAGDTLARDQASLEADTHRNRKISWIWWGVAAHLLSMADAYVDAHLSTFEADLGREERSGSGPPDPYADPSLSLALRVRF